MAEQANSAKKLQLLKIISWSSYILLYIQNSKLTVRVKILERV